MEKDPDSQEYLLETFTRRLEIQMESVDAFSMRASIVLATCGAVFAGYMQLLTIKGWVYGCGSILLPLEIVALLAAGGIAFAALAPGGETRPWSLNPELKALLAMHRDGKLDKERVLDSILKSHSANEDKLAEKYRMLTYARWSLYLSGALFFIHLILFLPIRL